MNRKLKSTTRILAGVLSFTLAFEAGAYSIVSANNNHTNKSQAPATGQLTADIGELPNKLPLNKLELTSKRTKYSTRYLNPDGSFTEEIFLEPHFYQDAADKSWKKIDNKLKASTKKAGKWENTSNDFSVWFAPEAQAADFLSLEKNGKSIDLLPVGGQKAKATVKEDQVTYTDLYENVDARYEVQGGGVKEDLILKKLPSQSTFSFELKARGVSAKEEKDGTISLTDATGEKVWYLDKPYMLDAEGDYSDDVELNLRAENGKTYVDVVIDEAYLKDADTQYPVTVDPTINNWDVMRDSFVASYFPNANYPSETFFNTGFHGYFGSTRAYAQFYLPSLPSDAKISKSTFNAYQNKTDSTTASVDLHRVNAAWDTSSLSVNNQPSFTTTPEATVTGNAANTYWSWDITKLTKDWYNGVQANYGFLLKQQNEATSPYRSFNSVNSGNNTPRLTIDYTVDPIGVEEFWMTTGDDVNPANGNLLLEQADLSISGRGVPVMLTRAFNSRKSGYAGMFGYGWTATPEIALVDSGSGPITLIDEDGTRHIFGQRANGTYSTPSGLYLDLVKNTDNTYVITKPEGTKLNFNTSGKLASIKDTNGNTTVFGYNTSGKLATITDASNRQTTLTYGANGFVSGVTDPAGRTLSYQYDAAGNLIKTTDGAGFSLTYAYDADHNLTSVIDARNLKTEFIYDTADRIQTIKRPITANGVKTTSVTTYSYDTANRVTAVTDGEGKRTDYTTNANGNVVQTTVNPLDAANKAVTTYAYDNNNNLTQVKDPNANKTGSTDAYVYTYDANGNITGVQLPGSQSASYAYNGQSQLTSHQDFNSNVNTFDYDKSNNQTEASDPYTQTSSKEYAANGNLLTSTHPMSVADNLVTNASFEHDGNADNWPDTWIKATEPGTTATFAYETQAKYGNKAISITNPTGWAVVYSDNFVPYTPGDNYVISGHIKTVGAQSTALVKAEFFDANHNYLDAKYTYEMKGDQDWTRVQTVVSEAPANTAYVRLAVSMNPGTGKAYFDGLQIEKGTVVAAFNLADNSSMERDADGNKIPDQWSTSGNLSAADGLATDNYYVGSSSFKLTGEKGKNKYLKQTIPVSGQANERFTLSGWSKQQGADVNGGYYNLQVAIHHTDGTVDWTNANSFDKTKTGWQHIATEVTAKKPYQSIDVYYYYYDQLGTAWFDAMRLEKGASHTSYGYDANGNYVTSVRNPLGHANSFTYDGVGNMKTMKTAKGELTAFDYDARNLLTKITDAKGGITQHAYDAIGNLTQTTDANAQVTKYAYNEYNQISSITNPLLQTQSFQYDRNGKLTKISTPKGDAITYTYDALNRMNSVAYNGAQTWSFAYDANGNITQAAPASGQTVNYTYDDNNRLTATAKGTANKLEYGYDSNNNLTALTITAGATTVTKGNEYDALNQLVRLTRNGNGQARFVYDERGNVTSVIYANNAYTALTYDDANRLSTLKNFKTDGTLLDSYTYTYDVNGNRTAVTTAAGTLSYEYDALHQLTKETLLDGTVYEYQYDAVGNRTKKIATKGTSVTTTTYTYDAGNQLTAVNGQAYTYDANGNLTANGAQTLRYNEENQLVEVKNAAGATLASYTYDHEGKRVSMTTATGTVYYHYNGNQVVYETDANNNLLAEYGWDANGLPVTMTKNGQTYYYQRNGHGDVTALTDASGAVVAQYTYDAWGNILSQSGEMAASNPYRYAGYRYDEATGLYYLTARYYDAKIGRFISRDTFDGFDDEPLSQNQYAYTKNNPVMHRDPSGHLVPAWILWAAGREIAIGVGYWWFTTFVRDKEKWSWSKHGKELAWTIFTSGINGILGKYLNANGIRKWQAAAYGVYLDIKWEVMSWSWNKEERPTSGWDAFKKILKAATSSVKAEAQLLW